MVADRDKAIFEDVTRDEKDRRIEELEEIVRLQDRKIIDVWGRMTDLEEEIKKALEGRSLTQEVAEFDPSRVNWDDPGVKYIFEVFSTRFAQVEAKMGRVMEENKVVMEENKKLKETVQQLSMENEQLKKKGKRSGGSAKSYNMNKRKCEQEDTTEHDDIRREAWTKTSEPPHYNTDSILHQCAATADITTCYICGNKLADSHTEYTRKTRDVKNGVLTETEWEIRRRYCRKCQMYCSAEPPGTLPNERFGIIIISQILIMRCMGMTYDKIMQILQMVYGERTVSSTLTGISERTAKRFWPIYNSLLDQIIDSELTSGDESGWFLDGTHCWTWVLVSNSVVFYNITPTRGKIVPTTFLKDFSGTILSDSYPAWNHIGKEHQKCLIHYFRDLYNTRDRNKSSEFTEFADEMISIQKDAMSARAEWSRVVPAYVTQELQDRIDRLIDGTYEDDDCKRWVKRLKRERLMVLTFLGYDTIPFHNNNSERALRPMAVARKIQYGSRSQSGTVTTTVLMTVFETCKLRKTNPYKFFIDYLSGKVASIPMPPIPIMVAA